MSARSATTRGYHHGNLREALLDQALLSVRSNGAGNLSLRDLARAIGVSQAAPYRHFPDRDALLAELATQGFRELAAEMLSAVSRDHLTWASRLQAVGLQYVEFAISHPEQYRLMFGSYRLDKQRHPQLLAAAGEAYGVLLETVKQGTESGEFRVEPVDILAATAWSIVHGLASLIIDERLSDKSTQDLRTVAERVSHLLMVGIAQPGSQRQTRSRR